jgi:hypothetical protein
MNLYFGGWVNEWASWVLFLSLGEIIRGMIFDEVLCKESEACFNSEEWIELMEADGEKVEWARAAVLRGVKDAYVAPLYQVMFFIFSAIPTYNSYTDSRIFYSTSSTFNGC